MRKGEAITDHVREAIPRCAQPFDAHAVQEQMAYKAHLRAIATALRGLRENGELTVERVLYTAKRERLVYRCTDAFRPVSTALVQTQEAAGRLSAAMRAWYRPAATQAAGAQ